MTDDRVASLARAMEFAMEAILAKNRDAVIDYPDLARAALAWMEANPAPGSLIRISAHDAARLERGEMIEVVERPAAPAWTEGEARDVIIAETGEIIRVRCVENQGDRLLLRLA